MLSSATAKTVWARKLIIAVLVVPVIALVIGTFYIAQKQYVRMHVGGQTYRLKIASTAQSRAQGLGNRSGMGVHEGMIFTYDIPTKTCFWMKDMLFSLDILWLDDSHEVVYMQQNASPATYPHAFCTPVKARYVIELNAGQAQRSGVGINDHLSF